MKCRSCQKKLEHLFVDLGFSPPSNAYINKKNYNNPEVYFPLKVFVCHNCWLVQTQDFVQHDQLFHSEYAYLSSTSKSWLKHTKDYVNLIIEKLSLSKKSFVIEIASNDGYLLKNFVKKDIPCLGVEPTRSAAMISKKNKINVIIDFFTYKLSKIIANNYPKADLVIGNNVFAHVPDINDFVKGIKNILKTNGTLTLEFPHLLKLLKDLQFDTIYHEHFSYYSLTAIRGIFNRFNLKIYDVDILKTHGGSLRIYVCHDKAKINVRTNVANIINEEKIFNINKLSTYKNFQSEVLQLKNKVNLFLYTQKKLGKKIAGYGAAAKGNTLINYFGIKNDVLDFVCDNSKLKQNRYLPGSRIPIVTVDTLYKQNPDLIIIFPWNISNEIINSVDRTRLSGKFVVLVPKIKYLR